MSTHAATTPRTESQELLERVAQHEPRDQVLRHGTHCRCATPCPGPGRTAERRSVFGPVAAGLVVRTAQKRSAR